MSEQEHWLEADEAETKLIVFGPPAFAADFADQLETALETGAVAAFVLDPAALAEAPPGHEAGALQAACRRNGAALFLLDDARMARQIDADGVHLRDPETVEAARAVLGAERLIGVSCGLSRHLAMVAGEAGADYVMFGALEGSAAPGHPTPDAPAGVDQLAETAAWWNDLFVLPVAVAGGPSAENAEALVRAGAAFLAVKGDAALAAVARTLAATIREAGSGTQG
ncbi:thiamine phosphate synthase [Marinimicrococcus flavescens]|uniref:Thiamine phosphate synthase n=1 Tax=Marinimicrococcus flavescens TaxID=3031815 RepID=A0AAP4D592_9PROT|nr:thiamine phosphate synthase [Marinimicrococcus flavescens]